MGIRLRQLKVMLDCSRTLEEECHRCILRESFTLRKMGKIRDRQRWDGKLLFPLDMEHRTAGHADGEMRATGQQVGHVWSCRQDLLEVVEYEQHVFVLQEGFEESHKRQCPVLFDFERLSDGGNDQVGVADRSQLDERDAIGKVVEELSGDLQNQAGFADTASPGEGHQTHLWT